MLMNRCQAAGHAHAHRNTHINQTLNKTSLKDHTHGYIKTIEKCRQFGLVSGGAVLLHKAAWWQL